MAAERRDENVRIFIQCKVIFIGYLSRNSNYQFGLVKIYIFFRIWKVFERRKDLPDMQLVLLNIDDVEVSFAR